MPKCPYCNNVLQPTRYCPTCRLSVTPHPEHYDGSYHVARKDAPQKESRP